MMRINAAFIVASLCSLASTFSIVAQKPFEVMFYNVENLFDTIDNPHTIDEDFTPYGKLEYNTNRFETKISNLAQVINASVNDGMPEIIGLCEVENSLVVNALISKLNSSNRYQCLVSGTNDRRGIQNALIVDKRFKVLDTEVNQVELKGERPTRPIYCVHLEDNETKERLWVIVNHWPSRYGGAEASNWKRVEAAKVVANTIERINRETPNSGIIVMGDFNDFPTNESLMLLEECKHKNDPCLKNMHKHLADEGLGTHAYQGEWNILDQILISDHFFKNGTFSVTPSSGKIIKHDWMLYESKEFEGYFPSRYFGSNTYYGGYSDHLPVIIEVSVN